MGLGPLICKMGINNPDLTALMEEGDYLAKGPKAVADTC